MMLVQNEVSSDRAIKHWKTYFDGFKPCYFPASLDGRPDLRDNFQESTVKLDVNDGAFLEFCSRHQLTPHSVFQTAWAIVIGHYAGVEDICFAYSTNSGEPSDLKADNLLVCRAQITAENLLVDTMADMMRDFDEASMHRKCSMTEIQKLLGLEGQQLFNSGLQIQHPFASEVGQWTQNRDMVKVSTQFSICLISIQNMSLTESSSAIYWPEYRSKMTLFLQYLFVHEHPSSLPPKQPMSPTLWERRCPKL
jgi:hypothetical protein